MISKIGNGASLPPTFESFRQKRFERADVNTDGQLSKDELSAALSKHQNKKGPGVDEIFAKVDTDQNGFVSRSENTAAFEKLPHRGPSGPPDAGRLAGAIFQKVDADSTGEISQEELTTALKDFADNSKIEAFFKSIDTDGNGSVTQGELESGLNQLFENAKPHRGCPAYTGDGAPAPSPDTSGQTINTAV